jgi:hypothetical protein
MSPKAHGMSQSFRKVRFAAGSVSGANDGLLPPKVPGYPDVVLGIV